MKTRDEFHKLIETIEDEEALKGYLILIQSLNSQQTGALWNSLTNDEKEELRISYSESLDLNNLISHDQVKKQHEKWLEKKSGPKDHSVSLIRL